MVVDLMSAHIDADGRVIALTRDGSYAHKQMFSEDVSNNLMRKLAKVRKIDLEHWNLEFKFQKFDVLADADVSLSLCANPSDMEMCKKCVRMQLSDDSERYAEFNLKNTRTHGWQCDGYINKNERSLF
jgi:hydrogenase maturation factor HypF (carbamoyltransferase family)